MLRIGFGGVLAFLVLTTARMQAAEEAPKSRTFRFTYAATLSGLPPARNVRIWLPIPPTTAEQDVKLLYHTFPVKADQGADPVYGNKMFSLESPTGSDGTIHLEATYLVTRREVKGALNDRDTDADKVKRFLQPDTLVPIDGKPLELLKGKTLPTDTMEKARVLYDVVNNHMKYDKSKPGWGRGDSAWACDSHFGNCTDFHSLFISLARAQKVPARFEIGFSIPTRKGMGEVTGYHCWAFFRPSDKGWVPVDISEANKDPKLKDYYFGNLTADRITMTTGRDLTLAPAQKGPAVNFLVAPYAEVDGKPVPADRIKMKNHYEDVK